MSNHLVFIPILREYLLADVLVLIETFLGKMALAQIHTELQILEHDRLVDLLPCPVFFAFDDIVQDIKGWLLLANLKELWINTKWSTSIYS